jgi:hypothetical protein
MIISLGPYVSHGTKFQYSPKDGDEEKFSPRGESLVGPELKTGITAPLLGLKHIIQFTTHPSLSFVSLCTYQ